MAATLFGSPLFWIDCKSCVVVICVMYNFRIDSEVLWIVSGARLAWYGKCHEFLTCVGIFVQGTCPSYFCGICIPLTEVGGRVRLRSAHRGDLCVPSTRTEFGKRSFRIAAPRTWNSLPLHLRSSTISRQQFQSGLKIHLFKRAYIWLLPPRTIEEWTYLLTYFYENESI